MTRQTMTYGDYLSLEQLLSAQHPQSDHHDEMLFILIHQVSELWMKLALHELHAAQQAIMADHLPESLKMLARIKVIQKQLIEAWSTLGTMTPSEYVGFRDQLGSSSGFQSAQYRELEFKLGNKNPYMLHMHERTPEVHARLKEAFETPGVYDTVLMLLDRRGFQVKDALREDFTQPYEAHESVLEAWKQVYTHPEKHWDLYNLAEKLIDLEDAFQQWRFKHLRTVMRIIGEKPGTGGTSGIGYLKKALDYQFFPELWQVRTLL
ncbi:tryptophan 2,3-dioxygenase [Deinococcus cellulosilyticus]|uniref:Tryptophan 2,3-dioxygenase n=1 Tax=Deinococcus cellulosilyticus (strain DSM 18568 / NBRC 106333 / KACC 11606 / 5516J-15) TaxID=1223518 RepID=A0A511N3R6_DEIC1|nr:tryptophan 2,3-dioxygenase [Deinococcus cellulosilyticus]GEM47519.1 tryptophan 2,3-dioxygenase [Deinococcus cellulosilyticus NBRC 106333 = KACC 11606]